QSPSLLHCSGAPPDLPSFPTRRSSDLARGPGGNPGSSPAALIERARTALQHLVPGLVADHQRTHQDDQLGLRGDLALLLEQPAEDRKSTRLNSSHVKISYAVFCLKKKT